MLRVAQNKDEIAIREIPVARWLGFAALALLISIPVLIALSSSGDLSEKFWLVGLGGGALSCLLLALLNPVTTTKINKPGQTVAVRKQSLLTYSFKVYSFNEIADLIYVEAQDGGRGGKVYQLIMPLKTGEKIELSTTEGSKRSQYFDAAMLLNPYIFDDPKEIPFKLTVLGDD
jgi:hypothetical protein